MAHYLKFPAIFLAAALLVGDTASAVVRKALSSSVQEEEEPNGLRTRQPAPQNLPQNRDVEELPQPERDTRDPLVELGLIPSTPPAPPQRVSPVPIDHSYDLQSDGSYDVVGSFLDPDTLGPRSRPAYPYNAPEYFPGHDAEPEEWGDLLELPYVRLGWFADVDATVMLPQVSAHFSSATRLDGVFPGNPVTLSAAKLDWSIMPKLELGYRFEHGLGELRMSYRNISGTGTDPLAGFDTAGLGTLQTNLQVHIVDLDCCYLEFSPHGLPKGVPWVSPLFKIPGRRSLGRRLTNDWFTMPVERRIYFGFRAATLFYDSTGEGDLLRERVTSNFSGAGLHFGFQMNQQFTESLPLFWHARGECSGMFGMVSQTFERTDKLLGLTGAGGPRYDSIGLPTLNVEVGLSWVPNLPDRQSRITVAYQFEQWFSFGEVRPESNASFLLQGVLARYERKF